MRMPVFGGMRKAPKLSTRSKRKETKKVEKNPFQLCFAQEVDDDQRRASCCKIMSRTCFTTFLASGSKRETASNCERWSSFILAEEQVIRSDVKGLRQSLDDIESGL